MGLLNRIIGLPEKDDGFIMIPVEKKIAMKYGWNKIDEQVVMEINCNELKLIKIKKEDSI